MKKFKKVVKWDDGLALIYLVSSGLGGLFIWALPLLLFNAEYFESTKELFTPLLTSLGILTFALLLIYFFTRKVYWEEV